MGHQDPNFERTDRHFGLPSSNWETARACTVATSAQGRELKAEQLLAQYVPARGDSLPSRDRSSGSQMTVNSARHLDVIMDKARAWAATFLLFPLPSSLAEAEQRQARSHPRRSIQVEAGGGPRRYAHACFSKLISRLRVSGPVRFRTPLRRSRRNALRRELSSDPCQRRRVAVLSTARRRPFEQATLRVREKYTSVSRIFARAETQCARPD
jgi:hypothetical protein